MLCFYVEQKNRTYSNMGAIIHKNEFILREDNIWSVKSAINNWEYKTIYAFK